MAILSVSGRKGSGKDTVGLIIQYLSSKYETTKFAQDNIEQSFLWWTKNKAGNYDWKIVKFADKLKDMVCLLIGCTRKQLEDSIFKETPLDREWWMYKSTYGNSIDYKTYMDHPEMEDPRHWEELDLVGAEVEIIKMTPRLMLQLIGTDCVRNIIHPNAWIIATMADYKAPELEEQISSMKALYNDDEAYYVHETEVMEAIDNQFGKGSYKKMQLSYYPNWIITDTRFPNELQAVKDRDGITIRVERKLHTNSLVANDIDMGVDLHESEIALNDAEYDYVIDNNGSVEELIEKVRDMLVKENLL